MSIQDHIQEFDRTNTIWIGVWTRSSGAIRISGTLSVRSRNYQYYKKRHTTRKVKSTNGNGRRQDFGRVSPRGIEIKRQSLA
jgi:hypothetical protein